MFMCPAYKRPHKLAELAESWEKFCPESPLWVRVWSGDEFAERYEEYEWPRKWKFYRSDAQTAGEAIQEFAETWPGERIGFVGEDIVISTPNAIEELEESAGEYYLAYPNDLIQRHALPTHFCVGPKLIKWLDGRLTIPKFPHHFLDTRLWAIAYSTGLLRYRPDVLFYHKHPAARRVAPDPVYEETEWKYSGAKVRWSMYLKEGLQKEVEKVKTAMWREFELPALGDLVKGAA